MPKSRLITIFAIALSSPVVAAGGGGGGGGGSMPSESAPQYDPAVEYQNGLAALQAKDFKKAKTAFDHVIAVAPKDANTQYLAGLSRAGLLDWKGARRNFAKAVKLDPSMLGAWRELGLADVHVGDAKAIAETLAAIKAERADCHETCAQAAEWKAIEEAVGAAAAGKPQAMNAAPGMLLFASAQAGDRHYLEAVSLINQRRFEEAIVSLKQSEAAFGPHPDILTYLGFANRKLKRFDVAEGYYLAALKAAPGHRGALEYYGELKVERGDLAGARSNLAQLDRQCHFGCTEAEELRAWIAAGHSPHSL